MPSDARLAERRTDKKVTVVALVLALALALGFQIWAITAHSLTGDGAYHLLTGHQSLRYGQNVLNLEHPPLVKMIVSLPLLFEEEPLAPPTQVSEALDWSRKIHRRPELLWRATVRGRIVALVCWVLPFFLAAWALGRRLGGATGLILVMLLGLSFSFAPYLTLLQTDTAICLAFLLTILAGLRFMERPGWPATVVLGGVAGLALAVKFSAVLLGPTVLVSVLRAPGLRGNGLRRLGQLALIGAISFGVVHLTYRAANRHYDPEVGRALIEDYCEGRGTLIVGEEMKIWQQPLLRLERIDPYLTQWLLGFLGVRAQNTIGVYPSFAFGEVTSQGRLWYFPAVLAVKTPMAVLALAAIAFVAWIRARRSAGDIKNVEARGPPGEGKKAVWLLAGLTGGLYLFVALLSNYNLSIRHMLPILPLLYLPLAHFLARRRRLLFAIGFLLAAEMLAVAPLWISQTNTWWLGSHNPTRFSLAAGNLEYRQNLVELKRWAEGMQIDNLTVLYPTLGEDVVHAYLPKARYAQPDSKLEPGWYAVSVMVEQFVPALLEADPETLWDYESLHNAAEIWQPYWQEIARHEDHGWVAGTFHIFRIPTTPVESMPRDGGATP